MNFYKFLDGEEQGVNYPTGKYIKENLIIINKLAKGYLSVAPREHHNIFCTGASGVIMATVFASYLESCNVYIIRKDGEPSHSGYSTYRMNDGVNIIVDDFILTGSTMERMLHILKGKGIRIDSIIVSSIGEVPLITKYPVKNIYSNLFCNRNIKPILLYEKDQQDIRVEV